MHKALIPPNSSSQASKGGVCRVHKSCFFIHAPMVLFICL
jgi:hypothetical protein